jgi:hypothetical protein
MKEVEREDPYDSDYLIDLGENDIIPVDKYPKVPPGPGKQEFLCCNMTNSFPQNKLCKICGAYNPVEWERLLAVMELKEQIVKSRAIYLRLQERKRKLKKQLSKEEMEEILMRKKRERDSRKELVDETNKENVGHVVTISRSENSKVSKKRKLARVDSASSSSSSDCENEDGLENGDRGVTKKVRRSNDAAVREAPSEVTVVESIPQGSRIEKECTLPLMVYVEQGKWLLLEDTQTHNHINNLPLSSHEFCLFS